MQQASIHSGKVLFVANPAAKNGAGAAASGKAYQLLVQALGEGAVSEVQTNAPGHASELAQQAAGTYSSIVVLGGDGTVHEAANGLMALPADQRPLLGIIPVGSGNDYARTLGLSENVEKATEQLLGASPKAMDVGCVNGEYFVETFSCGIDAAIALDTIERRKTSEKTGGALYFEAGVNQFLHHFETHSFSGVLDKQQPFSGSCLTMAVQIGPTYGGGFKICPDADPTDGIFDICYSRPTSKLHALSVFAMAKNGHHTNSTFVFFKKASSLHLDFAINTPAQADGEKVEGSIFDISISKQALPVLVPAQ